MTSDSVAVDGASDRPSAQLAPEHHKLSGSCLAPEDRPGVIGAASRPPGVPRIRLPQLHHIAATMQREGLEQLVLLRTQHDLRLADPGPLGTLIQPNGTRI
jgi:hypothetical protein